MPFIWFCSELLQEPKLNFVFFRHVQEITLKHTCIMNWFLLVGSKMDFFKYDFRANKWSLLYYLPKKFKNI